MKHKKMDSNAPPRTRGTPVVPVILFRPTGRDGPARLCHSGGPLGSSQMISGILVWLARGTPVKAYNFGYQFNADRACHITSGSLTLSGWRDADLSAYAVPDNVKGEGGSDFEIPDNVGTGVLILGYVIPNNIKYQLKLNVDRVCPILSGSLSLSGWRDADLSAYAVPDNVECEGGSDYEIADNVKRESSQFNAGRACPGSSGSLTLSGWRNEDLSAYAVPDNVKWIKKADNVEKNRKR